MRYYVIIPAHNEEAFLGQTLTSVTQQTFLPAKVVVVNDNSTDGTSSVISQFTEVYPFMEQLNVTSGNEHLPGSKVIRAFNLGLQLLDDHFDFIVKLDADVVLPPNYFETLHNVFSNHPNIGIAGGFIHEQDKLGHWVLNHPMDKDHVRGAIKAYSKPCFNAIGGLKEAMGWDTVDELLAKYHGYTIYTDPHLKVQHLRPLGKAYNRKAKLLQGRAMFRMRYGFWISMIASLKMAWKQKRGVAFQDNMLGYLKAKNEAVSYLVSPEEGKFIRQLRWRNIKKKLRP